LLKVKDVSPFKVGLLGVATFWFIFTFFEFVSNIIHASNRPWYIMVTDTLSKKFAPKKSKLTCDSGT